MRHKAGKFVTFNVSKQLEFLEGETFSREERQTKIDFLKDILREDPPYRTTACALQKLEALKYRDRYLFRRYLYHPDRTVTETARHAISRKIETNDGPCKKLQRMLEEGNSEDRVLLADYFLKEEGRLDVSALLSFLTIDDIKVRELIIKRISHQHEIDEDQLSEVLKKGSVWYVRAALIEILGKRKSRVLLQVIEELLKDKNVEVKLKLIDALANLGEAQARGHIESLCTDKIIWVRRRARRALQDMQRTTH